MIAIPAVPRPAVGRQEDDGAMKNMRFASYKTAFIAVLALSLMPLHALAGAGRFQVVAFGDSLLDAGTYEPFAKVAFHGGRFTTNPGLNFTQDIARHFGGRLTPAFVGGFGQPLVPAGGLNYAQGGSRVRLQPGIGHAPQGTPNADFAAATTVPVTDQVNAYLSAHGGFTSDQLVLINGGANDVFFQLEAAQAAGTPEAFGAALEAIIQSAEDLAAIVATVVEHGATHVAVMSLPDIGKSPGGLTTPDNGQLVTAVSAIFNLTLAIALIKQPNFAGKVIFIDAFSFSDNLIANYKTYGFRVSNTGIACDLAAQANIAEELCLKQPGSIYCINPANFGSSLFCSPRTYTAEEADYTFIFADLVHPTTHANQLFALFVEQQIAVKRW